MSGQEIKTDIKPNAEECLKVAHELKEFRAQFNREQVKNMAIGCAAIAGPSALAGAGIGALTFGMAPPLGAAAGGILMGVYGCVVGGVSAALGADYSKETPLKEQLKAACGENENLFPK